MSEEIKPFLNIGPGEFIKEELKVRNWTQEDLANVLGFSQKHVNRIIKNIISITTDTAKILSKAFGQSPQYWMNLDTNYRLRLKTTTQEEKETEIKSYIYKYMPIKEMIKNNWIKKYNTVEELKNVANEFWNIESKEMDFSFLDEELSLNFRKSEYIY